MTVPTAYSSQDKEAVLPAIGIATTKTSEQTLPPLEREAPMSKVVGFLRALQFPPTGAVATLGTGAVATPGTSAVTTLGTGAVATLGKTAVATLGTGAIATLGTGAVAECPANACRTGRYRREID